MITITKIISGKLKYIISGYDGYENMCTDWTKKFYGSLCIFLIKYFFLQAGFAETPPPSGGG